MDDFFWCAHIPRLVNLIYLNLNLITTDEILILIGKFCQKLEVVNIVSRIKQDYIQVKFAFINIDALFLQLNQNMTTYCYWTYNALCTRNRYFGLGPKPKLANTFCRYSNRYRNHISKERSSCVFFQPKRAIKSNLLPNFEIIVEDMGKLCSFLEKKSFSFGRKKISSDTEIGPFFHSNTNLRILYDTLY